VGEVERGILHDRQQKPDAKMSAEFSITSSAKLSSADGMSRAKDTLIPCCSEEIVNIKAFTA
jgi:hypothetical protein